MYIGIDLGTTVCKGFLYDEDGLVKAEFQEEYPLLFRADFIEQDAELWWQMTKKAVHTLMREANYPHIHALSLSTQSISFVPVDQIGKPLAPAIIWLDTRHGLSVEAMPGHRRRGPFSKNRGKPANPTYSLSKFMWLAEKEPELLTHAHKLLFSS